MSLQPFQDLVDAAVHALTAGAQRPFAPRDELLQGIDLIRDLAFDGTPEPDSQPIVDRHLHGPEVNDPLAAALLAALRTAAPLLNWKDMHNSGYGEEPGMEHFCDNFSYTALAESPRWAKGITVPSTKVGLTFTLQGPNTYYPDHAHKAVEIYYVIAGTALWKRGGEPWVERHPGEIILHTTGMRHAMQTRDQALISMAVWTSDVDSPIAVVRA